MARLGRYEIVRQLSKGALTDLLLGRSSGMEGFQRHVAIKRLRADFARDPKCLEAFVAEAGLAARLHHHNIVQVHDIGQEAGQPYFAMEYVHGVDLRTLLARLAKRNEQLPLQHVVQIIAAAAAALHHAHEQRGPDGVPLGIVHRDVTPANILVGYDGNVKVGDFGIAKAAIKRIQTDEGVLKGSVPYMAPEQCAGKSIDRRSDVFALGVVLYELATVRRLFKGSTQFLTMSAIVSAAVPKPSQYRQDIPLELEAIMLKALAREPENRFQSAGDMSLALDKVASTVGVGASTTALANYMRLQFGDQKEPWLLPTPVEVDNEPTIVDFDGAASGLAPPPSEAVHRNSIPRSLAASKSSPIAQMRAYAITPVEQKPKPELPSPRLKPPPPPKSTRPPPIDPGTLVPDLERTEVDPPRTDVETLVVRNPTPIPPTAERPVVVEKPLRDPTQVVTPLPTSYPVLAQSAAKSRLKWIAVVVAMVVGGGVAAIVLWPNLDLSEPQVAPAASPAAPPAPTPEPEPEALPAAEQPSAMTMTMRDYEREKAAKEPKPAPAEVKVEPPKPAEPAPKPAETNPAPTKIAKTTTTPKRTATKPAPAKHVEAKPPKHVEAKPPAKKPAKKKWNPDDLFLDEK